MTVIAKGKYSLASGARKTISVRFTRAGRKLLRKHKVLAAKLTLKAFHGKAVTKRVTLKVAPKCKKGQKSTRKHPCR